MKVLGLNFRWANIPLALGGPSNILRVRVADKNLRITQSGNKRSLSLAS